MADETREMENLQYARAVVRTSTLKHINEFWKARINGKICDIRVVEEVCGGCRHAQQAKVDVDDDHSIFSRISGEGDEYYL